MNRLNIGGDWVKKDVKIKRIICVRDADTGAIIPVDSLSKEKQEEVARNIQTVNIPNALDRIMEPMGYRRRGKKY